MTRLGVSQLTRLVLCPRPALSHSYPLHASFSSQSTMLPKKKTAPKRKAPSESPSDNEDASKSQSASKKAKVSNEASEPTVAANGQPNNKVLPVNINFPPRIEGTVRLSTWNICSLASASKKVRNSPYSADLLVTSMFPLGI